MNFIYERQSFAISLAYYQHHEPIFGLVYDVMNRRMMAGIHGRGAYVNDQKIDCSSIKSLDQGILDVNLTNLPVLRDHFGLDLEALAAAVLNVRHLGCASLRICDIALNRIHLYISASLSPWDYAAAFIFLEECGGAYCLFPTPASAGKRVVFAAQSPARLDELLRYCTVKNRKLSQDALISGQGSSRPDAAKGIT